MKLPNADPVCTNSPFCRVF